MKIEYPNNHDKPIFAAYQQQQIEVPKIEIAADGYSSFPETYITNHSIGMETAYYFFVAVQKYQYAVLTYHGNNLQNMIIKLTAFILTQETNIIVRHDRWLYPDSAKLKTPQRVSKKSESSHYIFREQGGVYEREQ